MGSTDDKTFCNIWMPNIASRTLLQEGCLEENFVADFWRLKEFLQKVF